ncbi:MAG: peptidase glycoprotease [Frankiales bacterium]|nr:peptidase glycoprotease [Frankiales bacterium]
MIALVIDTSSAAVTAGVVEIVPALGGAAAVSVRGERVKVDARAHGELLAVFVKESLDEAGLGMRDLNAVIAGVGPGPFTGLRVGLVTAAAISDALGVPAYPVCSLDAIAAIAQPPDVVSAGELLVAADARRREVYWAVYRDGRRRLGPEVDKPAELRIEAMAAVTAMAGAGARMYAEVLGLPLIETAGSSLSDYPTVLGLAQVAAADVLGAGPAAPLTPLYLRRPDAVAATASKAVSQP